MIGTGATVCRYRKKPVEIDAIRFEGCEDAKPLLFADMPLWFATALSGGVIRVVDQHDDRCCLSIATLEGPMLASPGDWIIRGIEEEIYPCKDSIFRASYEPVPGGHR